MKIDLHVHTSPLSPDSLMSPGEAIEAAKEIGLDGMCFTEHDRAWPLSKISSIREKYDFPVFRGVEVMLQGGVEMLVFGLNIDFTKLLQPGELRKMVTAAGGFMVCAHPFRGIPETAITDTAAALKTVLGRIDLAGVDAVEVLNGHNRDVYNLAAAEMAAGHGLRSTGGSDAHSVYEIGTCVTVFQAKILTEADLLRELHAGRFAGAPFRARKRWTWPPAQKPDISEA